MKKEQIKNWIVEQIKKDPKLAKEYKELRLSRLNAELKNNEAAFNRKGYMSYRNPGLSDMIIANRNSIREIESKTAEELLTKDFFVNYGGTISIGDLEDHIENLKKNIERIKKLNDEDHYIEGVFQGTKYFIRCKEDLDYCESRQDKNIDKIKSIYKKGLSKRDEFIKKGEKSHQRLLAEQEAELKKYEDIDKRGPEIIQKLIDEKENWKKFYCRELALMSVVDAFDAMGAHPAPKQKEQIDKIIEMHDPSVVESAMQRLIENPTENLRALAQNIREAPVQDRKTLRHLKALDIANLALGGATIALGLVSTVMGHPSLLPAATVVGSVNLGLGISGMIRHTRKTNNLDEKEILMSGCIQDLLDEVVLQETFDKGLER